MLSWNKLEQETGLVTTKARNPKGCPVGRDNVFNMCIAVYQSPLANQRFLPLQSAEDLSGCSTPSPSSDPSHINKCMIRLAGNLDIFAGRLVFGLADFIPVQFISWGMKNGVMLTHLAISQVLK